MLSNYWRNKFYHKHCGTKGNICLTVWNPLVKKTVDDNSYCANRWLWTIYKRFEAHHFQLVLSHKLPFNVFSLHQHSNQPLKRTKTTQGHKQKCTGAVKRTLVIKVNTANLDRFCDEITHHRPPAKNTSDRNRHSPWFPAKRRGERAQGAFLPFQLLWGAIRAKADLSAVSHEETCGSHGAVWYSTEARGQCQRVIPAPPGESRLAAVSRCPLRQ